MTYNVFGESLNFAQSVATALAESLQMQPVNCALRYI